MVSSFFPEVATAVFSSAKNSERFVALLCQRLDLGFVLALGIALALVEKVCNFGDEGAEIGRSQGSCEVGLEVLDEVLTGHILSLSRTDTTCNEEIPCGIFVSFCEAKIEFDVCIRDPLDHGTELVYVDHVISVVVNMVGGFLSDDVDDHGFWQVFQNVCNFGDEGAEIGRIQGSCEVGHEVLDEELTDHILFLKPAGTTIIEEIPCGFFVSFC